MQTKKILFLESESMLNSGLLDLLTQDERYEIFGHAVENLNSTISEIEKIEPDAVVIDDSIMASYLAALFLYVSDFRKMHTVVVSAKDTVVHVFDIKRVEITEMTDFFTVL